MAKTVCRIRQADSNTRRLNLALADRVGKELAAVRKEVSAESRNSLKVLHKVDLPSTLGVTLTFISTDGG